MTDIPLARELEAAVERMTKLVERLADSPEKKHSVRVEPSLMESLAIADQHDLQVRSKW